MPDQWQESQMSGGGSFSGLFHKKGAAAPEMPPLVRPQPGPANAPTDPSPGVDDHVTEPLPFERTPIPPAAPGPAAAEPAAVPAPEPAAASVAVQDP